MLFHVLPSVETWPSTFCVKLLSPARGSKMSLGTEGQEQDILDYFQFNFDL